MRSCACAWDLPLEHALSFSRRTRAVTETRSRSIPTRRVLVQVHTPLRGRSRLVGGRGRPNLASWPCSVAPTPRARSPRVHSPPTSLVPSPGPLGQFSQSSRLVARIIVAQPHRQWGTRARREHDQLAGRLLTVARTRPLSLWCTPRAATAAGSRREEAVCQHSRAGVSRLLDASGVKLSLM